MGKFCRKCGKTLEKDMKFCGNCGTEVIEEKKEVKVETKPVEVKNTEPVANNNSGNIFGILALVLFFIGGGLAFSVSEIASDYYGNAASSVLALIPLAGIVLMIIGRVLYPKNKFLTIVMWVIIGVIASILLFIAFIYLTCYLTCYSNPAQNFWQDFFRGCS